MSLFKRIMRAVGMQERRKRSFNDVLVYRSDVSTFYLQYLKTFGRASTGLPNKVVVGYGGSGSCPI
jgi:hypothetical protein